MSSIYNQEYSDKEQSNLEQKEQSDNVNKKKIINLKKDWTERPKLLTLYYSSFAKKLNEEKEKEIKAQKIIELKQKQINYSNNIPLPLKLLKENNNCSLMDRKISPIKNNFNSILVNSLDNSEIIRKKNSNLKKTKINDNNKENNKSIDDIDKKKNIIKNNKVYDYLSERRKINKEENYNKNSNDIKRYLNKNGINDETLNLVKCKLQNLDEQKRQKKLLLKYNDIGKNPKLEEEFCDIMIDSINARISFIQKLENFDDNTNININKSFKNESKKSIKIESLDNNCKNNEINDQIEVKNLSLSKEPNNQLKQEIEKNNQINNEIKNSNQLNEENEEENEFEEENNVN